VTPIGEALRAARDTSGVTLEQASAVTKIRVTYLQALEDERFDVVGGAVYVKGFLREYAAFLGLDPEPLVAAYRATEPAEPSPSERPARHTRTRLDRRGPNWLGVAIVCVAVLLGVAVVGLVTGQPGPGSATTTTSRPATAAPTTVPVVVTHPHPHGVTLTLRFTAPSWTEVTSDGRVVFEGTLLPGEQRSFTGVTSIGLVLGYPPGVTLEVNGKNLGVAGAANQVYRGSFAAA